MPDGYEDLLPKKKAQAPVSDGYEDLLPRKPQASAMPRSSISGTLPGNESYAPANPENFDLQDAKGNETALRGNLGKAIRGAAEGALGRRINPKVKMPVGPKRPPAGALVSPRRGNLPPAPDRQPSMQPTRRRNVATSIGPARPMAPADRAKYEREKAEEEARYIKATTTPLTDQVITGPAALRGADEAQTKLTEAVSPVVSPVANALAAVSPIWQMSQALGLVQPGSAGGMASGMAGGLLSWPVQMAAELAQISDPAVSLRDKAGAAANIGFELVGGKVVSEPVKAVKTGAKAVRSLTKAGKAEKAIEETLASGIKVPPKSIPQSTKEILNPKKPNVQVKVNERDPVSPASHAAGDKKVFRAPNPAKVDLPKPEPNPEVKIELSPGAKFELENPKSAGARGPKGGIGDAKTTGELKTKPGPKVPPPGVKTAATTPKPGTKAYFEQQAGVPKPGAKPGAPMKTRQRGKPPVEDVQAPTAKVGSPKPEEPTQAFWRNKDVDQPITLTGRIDTYKDGRKFAEVEIDGVKSWVPDDEVIRPDGRSGSTVGPKTGQGTTNADLDDLRREIGWEPSDKARKSDADLLKEAKRHAGNEDQIAQRVIDNPKGRLTDSEVVAMSPRIAQLKAERLDARARGDADAFLYADDALNKIADALEKSGKGSGREIRARRFVAMEDDAWSLERRLDKKIESEGLDAGSKEAARIRGLIKTVEDLEAENLKLKNSTLDDFVKTERKSSSRMTKEELDAELDDLFKQFTQKVSKASSGLDPELLPLVGKIALNRAKRLGLGLEDAVKSTIEYFKAKGQTVSRDDVIEGIADANRRKSNPRTEAQKNLDRLRAEARQIQQWTKEGKAVPTKEARRFAQIQEQIKKLEEQLKNPGPKVPPDKRPKSAMLEIEEAKLKAQREAVRRAIDEAGKTKGIKAAEVATTASTEAKLLNPISRAIDVLDNTNESALSKVFGHAERLVANPFGKKTGAAWRAPSLAEKKIIANRWKVEAMKLFEESKIQDMSRYATSGTPGGKLSSLRPTRWAGMADTPFRAYHFTKYMGERASAIAKKRGMDFEQVFDQIRNPEKRGPLPQREALDIHNAARDFTEVNMLTNDNWGSKGRTMAKQLIDRDAHDKLKPILHGIVDMTFQFGRVLVNVADRGGQYSNPLYGAARALLEIAPRKGDKIAREARVRQFSQIVRRSGVGMGTVYAGKVYYENGGRLPDILGPEIVRTLDKDGKNTGNVYQDDGYLSMIGGLFGAFTNGYRQAQIEDTPGLSEAQKQKMRVDLWFAPFTDNPIVGNVKRALKVSEGNFDTLQEFMVGMYWPGGLREWSTIQMKQEGVYSRRSDGLVESFKKRVPYSQATLDAKGVAYDERPNLNAIGLPAAEGDKNDRLIQEFDRIKYELRLKKDEGETDKELASRTRKFLDWAKPKMEKMALENSVQTGDVFGAWGDMKEESRALFRRVVKDGKIDYKGATLSDKKELAGRLRTKLYDRYISKGGPGHEDHQARQSASRDAKEKKIKQEETAGRR